MNYMKDAVSIESRAVYGKENLDLQLIETIDAGRRLYDIYKDSEGNIWYSTKIRIKEEIKAEYEAIFGRKNVERKKRY